jgi:hypothetical protein
MHNFLAGIWQVLMETGLNRLSGLVLLLVSGEADHKNCYSTRNLPVQKTAPVNSSIKVIPLSVFDMTLAAMRIMNMS